MESDGALLPHMSKAEIALLARHIPFGGRALEFGCGGSTAYLLQNGMKDLTSVESDLAWLEKVLREPVPRHFFLKKRWRPVHADIGPTREWGFPAAKEPEPRWLCYHQYCWELMPGIDYDFILIDGRFRVACLCQSLLYCAKPDVAIVMHDFWSRPQYHAVLDFVTVEDRADDMAVMRPLGGLSREKLAAALERFLFDPS